MVHRLTQGRVPPKHHQAFRRGETLYFEECFTREGFDGPYSLMYHAIAPTDQADVRVSERGWGKVEAHPEAPVSRHHYKSQNLTPGGTHLDARVPLFTNTNCTLYVARPTLSDDCYYANADGDDLYYIHEGEGVLESSFGDLAFGPGDYVYVPRAVIHRLIFNGKKNYLFVTEGARVSIPAMYLNPVGQLRMDAPYNHRDFRAPTLPVDGEGYGLSYDGPHVVTVKRQGAFYEHDYKRCPLDIVGWDGTCYPTAFNIHNFQPKVSSYHLPPNVHGTFQGSNFVVCSFVPRKVDFGEGAIPCPYPHSNVHCDEVLFYCSGDFTSRKGVGPGSLSYHPMGLPHGPQPGAYEASIGSTDTHELAVMVDTFDPLFPTRQAVELEDGSYHSSWLK